jgi:hypothetical protein
VVSMMGRWNVRADCVFDVESFADTWYVYCEGRIGCPVPLSGSTPCGRDFDSAGHRTAMLDQSFFSIESAMVEGISKVEEEVVLGKVGDLPRILL